jgi:hypothetical protein
MDNEMQTPCHHGETVRHANVQRDSQADVKTEDLDEIQKEKVFEYYETIPHRSKMYGKR